MSQPTALPTCPTCAAIRMPGAPMCTTCWTPFADAAPAAATPTPPPSAPRPSAPAPTTPDSRFVWGATVPEQPAAPADEAVPAGAHPGWRPPLSDQPLPDTRPAGRRGPGRRVIALVAVVVLALVAVGGVTWVRSMGQSEEEFVADRFRNARPAGFLPAFPHFDLGGTGLPETAGAAAAFMTTFEPLVRQANSDLVATQEVLFDWSDGDVDDDAVRAFVETLLENLDTMSQAAIRAPESLSRGASKLSQAATDYSFALNSLLDWLDSRSASAKTTFSFSIGEANVNWDEGVIALYRAAGLPQPELPHPQVRD